jgi:hypothetical protein
MKKAREHGLAPITLDRCIRTLSRAGLLLVALAVGVLTVEVPGQDRGGGTAEELPPPVLNVASQSVTEVRLTISAVRGADSYRIEGAGESSFQNPAVISRGERRMAVDTGLKAGERRYYRARARTDAGTESPWSIVRFVTAYSPVYPAEKYELATGFGLRRLDPDYEGPAIQVRRTADEATRDIGFVGRELDTIAIEDFSRGGDVVVTKFYDQIDVPGAYVPQYSSHLPLIAKSGSMLLGQTTGRPYVDMRGNGPVEEKYFRRSSPLSAPVRRAASTAMLCVEVREQAAGDHSQGALGSARRHDAAGSLGAWQGRFTTGGTGGDASTYQQYTRHRTWHGGLFLDGAQHVFAGTKVVSEASRNLSGSYNQPYFLAGNPWHFSEALIFTGVSSPAEYRRRLWTADCYWRAAPTESQYGLTDKMECQYRFQGVITKWLSQRRPEDFVVHAIRSVGNRQLTVKDVDWTHLRKGHTIYAHDRVLTLSSGPSLSENGEHTVLPVNEETLGKLQPGQQVVFRPKYDGSFERPEDAANLKMYFRFGGDGSLLPGLNGRADPRWYAWDTGESPVAPGVTDWAVLDESRPDRATARPEKLQIQGGRADSGRKVGLVRVPLKNLRKFPSSAVFSLYNNELGSEDDAKPYVGVQVYEDLEWNSRSVSWNSMQDAIDLGRKYDDIEGVDEGREERAYLDFRLTDRVREAHGSGASSVTLVFYDCAHQYGGAKKTRRSVYFDGPRAARAPRIRVYRAYGLVATDRLRVPDILRGAYNYGGGWQVAAWTRPELDFPCNGGRGNPFTGNAAMKRRALVVDMANAVQLTTAGNIYNWSRYYGGYLLSLAHSLRFAGYVLPFRVRRAARQALLHLAESGRRYPYDAGANSNMDVRSAEGAMTAYSLFDGAYSDAREQLVESAKFILMKDRHGDPRTDEAIWHREGNIYEGRTPEGSYNNRSLSHLVDGRAVVWNEEAWEWVDVMIRRMATFQERQFGLQPEGRALDCSGYSGRTPDGVLGGQYHSSSPGVMGVLYPEARWHLRSWARGGDFIIPRSGQDAAKGAQKLIENLGDFTVITSVPPAWSGRSSWQARAPEPPPVEGWWQRARQWADRDAGDLYPVFHPDSVKVDFVEVRPESGHPDWFILKAGSEGRHWGTFLDVRRKSGAYGGGFGGVHMLWSEGYGVVLSSRRPGGRPAENKLMEGVLGRDENGELFSFYQNVREVRASTRVNLEAARVVHEYTLRGKNLLSKGASWKLRRTYTGLSTAEGDPQNGLRIDLLMEYSPGAGGRDEINDLWWSLPLAAGVAHHAPEIELSYWDRNAWVPIPPNTPANAKEWKVDRAKSSFWLRFGSPVTLELLARRSKNRTVGHPVLINLHPARGHSTQPVPTEISRTLILTRTNPGYEGTAVSPSLNYPKNGEVLPVGGLWQIQGELNVPRGRRADELYLEHSTDGGETWRVIASLDPASGEKLVQDGGRIHREGGHRYTYVGDDVEIPAGLTNVRIRSVAEDERSQSFRASSSRPRVVVREDFTVEEDTAFDSSYELDLNKTGNSIYVPRGKVVVDAESGCATARNHESWFNQARINVGTVNFLTSIRLKDIPDRGGGAGLLLRSGSYYQNVRGVLRGGQLRVSQVMNNIGGTAFDLEEGEEYVLRAQSIGSTVTFSLWNGDESRLLARYTRFGNNPGAPAVGFGFKSAGVKVDDWVIETFAGPPADR